MENRLLGDRVLIEVEESETRTASGLLLSVQTDPSDLQIGRVVAVGSGKWNDNGVIVVPPCKVDEKVLFQYGKTITVDGKQYQLVIGDDVIMVMKQSEGSEG